MAIVVKTSAVAKVVVEVAAKATNIYITRKLALYIK